MMLFREMLNLLNVQKFIIVEIKYMIKIYSVVNLVEMTMGRFWTTSLSLIYFINTNFLIDLNEPDVS